MVSGSVVVSSSVLHARVLGSGPGPGMGMFGEKPGSQHWELCIHRDSDDLFNVGPYSFN